MAWYRNHYHCDACGTDWTDEWSCCCDDDCPSCGSRHWSPYVSEDLTEIICEAQHRPGFVFFRSPDNADDKPRYEAVAWFPTEEAAQRYVVDGELI